MLLLAVIRVRGPVGSVARGSGDKCTCVTAWTFTFEGVETYAFRGVDVKRLPSTVRICGVYIGAGRGDKHGVGIECYLKVGDPRGGWNRYSPGFLILGC
jgi:hypothetical protein